LCRYFFTFNNCYIRIPFYKKLLSYFYPVSLKKAAGSHNDYLELRLFWNQYQLVTNDALYSDGNRYAPAIAVTRSLKKIVPAMKHVLLLGAGLCSMIVVMRRRNMDADFTVVEKDNVVLEWAMGLFSGEQSPKIEPLCADAANYIEQSTARHDLIFIDVFNGRVVPDFVITQRFLSHCRDRLSPGGHVAFNYIVNDEAQWAEVRQTFSDVFPTSSIMDLGVNRVLIGSS
jgi:spermidine synthase